MAKQRQHPFDLFRKRVGRGTNGGPFWAQCAERAEDTLIHVQFFGEDDGKMEIKCYAVDRKTGRYYEQFELVTVEAKVFANGDYSLKAYAAAFSPHLGKAKPSRAVYGTSWAKLAKKASPGTPTNIWNGVRMLFHVAGDKIKDPQSQYAVLPI